MGQSVFLYEAMGLSVRHLTARFGVLFYESTRETLCRACLLALALEASENLEETDVFETGGEGLSFEQFGDYELLHEISRGGMGVVYAAYQVSLKRKVAIKFVRSERLESKEARQRFQLESETAAGLDHPNIVPVYEVGESGRRPYVTMKLIEGGTLAEQIASGAFLTESGVIGQTPNLLAKVARAVHYAHTRGVLHRDLKPSNILLDQDGIPFVTDFGLVKLEDDQSGLTHPKAMLGTPRYMSPEQCRSDGHAVSTLSDVYALGVILYEMLAGRPPFEAASTVQLIQQIVEARPLPPVQDSATRLRGSRDLETICLKCLEKEPAHRYESAAALADDLERVAGGEPILARRVGTVETVVKWARRRPGVAALVASTVLAIVVGGLAAWLLWQEALRLNAKAASNLYVSDMSRAAQAIEAGDADYAKSLLDMHLPRKGDTDTRGWEWYYLYQLVQSRHDGIVNERAYALARSPDDKEILMANEEGIVWWSMLERRETRRLAVGRRVDDIEVSPDGRWLALLFRDEASGLTKATVRVVDYQSLEILAESEVEAWWRMAEGSLSFVPGKPLLLIAGNRDAHPDAQPRPILPVRRWEFLTNEPPQDIADTTGKAVTGVDGGQFVTIDGSSVAFWDQSTWRRVGSPITLVDELTTLAISPHGLLMVAMSGSRFSVLNASTREVLTTIDAPNADTFTCVAFLDEETILTAGKDRSIRAWDWNSADNDPLGKAIQLGHRLEITSLVVTDSGAKYATAGADGVVKIWNTGNMAPAAPFPSEPLPDYHLQCYPAWPVVSQGGRYLAAQIKRNTSDDEFRTAIWDFKYGRYVSRVPGGVASWMSVDGAKLVTLQLEGFDQAGRPPPWFPPALMGLVEWDARNDPAVRVQEIEFAQSMPGLTAYAVSPDGREIAVGHQGGRIVLCDAVNGREIEEITVLGSVICGLVFSPDGAYLLWTHPRQSGLRHLASGKQWSLPGTVGTTFFQPHFSPDGQSFAYGAADGMVRIRTMSDPSQPWAVLRGHLEPAKNLSFSPDGRTLAVSQGDSVKLWHLDSQRELMILSTGRKDGVRYVHFSPDSRQLLYGGFSQRLSAWMAR